MPVTPQVHLLFGFLGSGKTTLVRNLLENLEADVPTAVIVNEFGEVGIDGEIIQGKAIDTVELVSGCICCTLRGSLLNALEELAEQKGTQRIIVEATGIADPEDMLDDLEDPSVRQDFDIGPIVTVVDSANFNKIRSMLGEFYVSQVLNADNVILNKIDLADKQTVQNVADQVKQINPDAEIRFAEHCDVESSFVFSSLNRRDSVNTQTTLACDHHDHDHHHHEHNHNHRHHEHDTMMSVVVQPFDNFSKSDFESALLNLPERIWRVKGHMLLDKKPALIQYASGVLDISTCDPRDHYRLVVIGQSFEAEPVMTSLGKTVAESH